MELSGGRRAITRRNFMGGVAGGLVFVGCGLTRGLAQSSARRPVVLKGKRVRTIDVHAHCAVPRASELMHRQQNGQAALALDGQPLDQRLKDMDAQGIDVAVLSINPNWYDVDQDLAARVIALQNEALAECCATHAERFAALASVALQFPDLAAEQLETAIRKQGLRGVAIGGSVAGLELSDRKFDPFWARAEQLGSVVFIHPQPPAQPFARLNGNGLLRNVIGNPLETTIALSHLIFEGTLDRFPRLKICAAHGGGYLPSYMARSDHGCKVFPDQCVAGQPKRAPTSYVKQLYYDSLVFTPEGLRHLVAEVGVGQVVLGTDYPYPWVNDPVGHVLKTPGLSHADREAILGGTATTLLGLRPTT